MILIGGGERGRAPLTQAMGVVEPASRLLRAQTPVARRCARGRAMPSRPQRGHRRPQARRQPGAQSRESLREALHEHRGHPRCSVAIRPVADTSRVRAAAAARLDHPRTRSRPSLGTHSSIRLGRASIGGALDAGGHDATQVIRARGYTCGHKHRAAIARDGARIAHRGGIPNASINSANVSCAPQGWMLARVRPAVA